MRSAAELRRGVPQMSLRRAGRHGADRGDAGDARRSLLPLLHRRGGDDGVGGQRAAGADGALPREALGGRRGRSAERRGVGVHCGLGRGQLSKGGPSRRRRPGCEGRRRSPRRETVAQTHLARKARGCGRKRVSPLCSSPSPSRGARPQANKEDSEPRGERIPEPSNTNHCMTAPTERQQPASKYEQALIHSAITLSMQMHQTKIAAQAVGAFASGGGSELVGRIRARRLRHGTMAHTLVQVQML